MAAKMVKRQSDPGRQAVLRAVALLRIFTDERPELTLAELSRGAGISLARTRELLALLESVGFIARNADAGTYRLGSEIFALGSRAARSNSLVMSSRPELEALARETGETASIEVLVGPDALILDEVAGSHIVGSLPSIGTRWPAHATSTGKVILAFSAEGARSAAQPARLSALTSETISDPAAFRAELRRVRRQGYATGVDELEVGFVAIGAPVYGPEGLVVASVSLGGPKARLNNERIQELGDLLKKSGERISRRLGFTGAYGVVPRRRTRRREH